MYNFDEIIERKGTSCAKWDAITARGYDPETVAMWVADMDFKVLPEITEAVMERLSHPIYGYSMPQADYKATVCEWMKKRHEWDIEEDWIVMTPGVVTALKLAVNAYTNEGDAVIIQKPVYYPFDSSVELNGRIKIENPTIFKGDHYEIDFADFEQKIIDNNVK